MQSSPIAPPWRTCYYYPLPNHHHLPITKIKPNPKPEKCQSLNHTFVTLSATHKENQENNTTNTNTNNKLLHDFSSPVETRETQFRETLCDEELLSGISSNTWWAGLKAALGQRINVEGLISSVGILSKDKQLVIPHVVVPDITCIDWVELKNRGFEGVVFDKDNTITAPYALRLWPPLGLSIELCKSLFGDNIAVFSNSAGLQEYDPDGREAGALEDAIGIKVIRHRVKKPAGTAEEIERHFGCESSKLVMVGDRPFTDIVYGNRNGFFTILTEPLSLDEEPWIVKNVRLLEVAIVEQWCKTGVKPINHMLLADPIKCVKDVPLR